MIPVLSYRPCPIIEIAGVDVNHLVGRKKAKKTPNPLAGGITLIQNRK
jgi:hypothetical protein